VVNCAKTVPWGGEFY
jgi:hypothetical protein